MECYSDSEGGYACANVNFLRGLNKATRLNSPSFNYHNHCRFNNFIH